MTMHVVLPDEAGIECPVCGVVLTMDEVSRAGSACDRCRTDLGPLLRLRQLASLGVGKTANVAAFGPGGSERSERAAIIAPTCAAGAAGAAAGSSLRRALLAGAACVGVCVVLGGAWVLLPRGARLARVPVRGVPPVAAPATARAPVGGAAADTRHALLRTGLAAVAERDGQLVVTFRTGLFGSGSAHLTGTARAGVRRVARALSMSRAPLAVRVVGCTDAEPMAPGSRWGSPAGLGYARAASGAAAMQAAAVGATIEWEVASAGGKPGPFATGPASNNRTLVLYVRLREAP